MTPRKPTGGPLDSIWRRTEIIDQLVALSKLDLTNTAIALLLSNQFDVEITRNAVIGKITRMGLRRPADVEARSPHAGIARGKSKPPMPPKVKPPIFERANNPIDPHADEWVPTSQRLTFYDLEPQHCRWPIGEPSTPDFRFCGGHRVIGKSYCEAHVLRAYQQPAPQRRLVSSEPVQMNVKEDA